MPLDHSRSDAAFKSNVRNLMDEVGHSPHVQSRAQALAIAYDIKRHGRAHGGATDFGLPHVPANVLADDLASLKDIRMPSESKGLGKPGYALGGAPAPWQVRAEARSMLHTGPILSAVPGRTDRHNMSVASGSYVVPAQAVSHLGQSNTLAGMKVLNSMFGSGGPYGAGGMKIAHGRGPPPPPRMHAAGGDIGGARGDGDTDPVDVVTAGGEYVVPPASVAAVGGGDMKHGHDVLDSWVNSILDDHIRTLKKLPPPAKS